MLDIWACTCTWWLAPRLSDAVSERMLGEASAMTNILANCFEFYILHFLIWFSRYRSFYWFFLFQNPQRTNLDSEMANLKNQPVGLYSQFFFLFLPLVTLMKWSGMELRGWINSNGSSQRKAKYRELKDFWNFWIDYVFSHSEI